MHHRPSKKEGFTLIELLVVIAIIAILTVVVILTLNPAEILKQSRDANRVSDMATISNAVNLYIVDQGGSASSSLGNASSIYISTPDTTSTCANLGLPSLPSGSAYGCSSSTSSRATSGQGWIPINFQSLSSGSPLSSLPVDPTNQTSTGLYYTYVPSGNSQYEVISSMESQKYKQSVTGSLGSGVDVAGSNQGTAPVGWWPLTEGSGTVVYDTSGNGNNGAWVGTATGTSGYYSAGKVGAWAGAFDGTSTYVNVTGSIPIAFTGDFTIMAWVKSTPAGGNILITYNYGNNIGYSMTLSSGNHFVYFTLGNPGFTSLPGYFVGADNSWHQVVFVRSGSTAQFYGDGIAAYSQTGIPTGSFSGMTNLRIGGSGTFLSGLINDLRFYSRALSPAEIQAIYRSEK